MEWLSSKYKDSENTCWICNSNFWKYVMSNNPTHFSIANSISHLFMMWVFCVQKFVNYNDLFILLPWDKYLNARSNLAKYLSLLCAVLIWVFPIMFCISKLNQNVNKLKNACTWQCKKKEENNEKDRNKNLKKPNIISKLMIKLTHSYGFNRTIHCYRCLLFCFCYLLFKCTSENINSSASKQFHYWTENLYTLCFHSVNILINNQLIFISIFA